MSANRQDKLFTKEDFIANGVFPLRPINIDDYRPIGFNEMKATPPPLVEYVINPCLPTQGLAFIYAATGLGKTLFTMNLAYAIAGGGNFLKYYCPRPRKVLYIDAEMAFNQIHQRLMLIEAEQGALDFPDNLDFLTPDKLHPLMVPQIDTLEGQQIYLDIIKKYDYEVIIFDNLSMLASFDENKSHEWKPIQAWLLSLRALGKTCIIVHHAGKDKNSYRGTSRMLDAADVAISLQPMNDDLIEENSTEGKKFKVVYQKARNFNGHASFPYEATFQHGKWSYQSIETCMASKVVECMEAKMSQRDIAKELLISQSTVNRLVRKSRREGLIHD